MNDKEGVSGKLVAGLYLPPLRVEQLMPNRTTPGNVGVCLSGGGSRALTAGMGQLRALSYLQANGASLLSQVKALSTVSGGSWVGTTFQYLGGSQSPSDDDYLNTYVPDQHRLVLTRTPDHSLAETLDELPDGNIGHAPANPLMGPVALAIEAVLLKVLGVPTDMIWQTLMGWHILKPYGLYKPGDDHLPASCFSFDQTTRERDIIGPNPDLTGSTVCLYADALDPSRTPRPYLICNLALFVALPDDPSGFKYLTPSHASPFLTGVPGAPDALDSNHQYAGGGGITSFAFGSSLVEADREQGTATVEQQRQWSLTDAVGTSSACFAQILEDIFTTWRDDPRRFFADLHQHDAKLRHWLAHHLTGALARAAENLCDKSETLLGHAMVGHLRQLNDRKLHGVLDELKDLVPSYGYWSVKECRPVADPQESQFADGGDLENTGIASMLTYLDIERIITFVNSSDPLQAADHGVIGPDGHEIPLTGILVSDQLPPLFGYQPYRKGIGYKLYAGDDHPVKKIFRYNQVFPSVAFSDLLRGLWRASGNEQDPGSDAEPAIFRQELAVVENRWCGVAARPSVTVLWVYNNFVRAWYDRLDNAAGNDVAAEVDKLRKEAKFPWYSTLRTHLTPTEVNLLANLSAWVVANDRQAPVFQVLFSEP